jgi:hypothetical protein
MFGSECNKEITIYGLKKKLFSLLLFHWQSVGIQRKYSKKKTMEAY